MSHPVGNTIHNPQCKSQASHQGLDDIQLLAWHWHTVDIAIHQCVAQPSVLEAKHMIPEIQQCVLSIPHEWSSSRLAHGRPDLGKQAYAGKPEIENSHTMQHVKAHAGHVFS